jgi:hypothetical protein
MHEFVEHPEEIPVEMSSQDSECPCESDSRSFWGLRVRSFVPVFADTSIEVKFSLGKRKVHASGKVVRCDRKAKGYMLWVQFSSFVDCHKARLAEQACHMESWRMHQEALGKPVDTQNAYAEWLTLYAASFPGIEMDY